jgi:hypothetical protein
VNRTAIFKRAIDPRDEAAMRKVYNSGADQVLAKASPRLFVTVSVPQLI